MRLTKKLKEKILETSKDNGYWSDEVKNLLNSLKSELSESAWEKAHNIAREQNIDGIREVYR